MRQLRIFLELNGKIVYNKSECERIFQKLENACQHKKNHYLYTLVTISHY